MEENKGVRKKTKGSDPLIFAASSTEGGAIVMRPVPCHSQVWTHPRGCSNGFVALIVNNVR